MLYRCDFLWPKAARTSEQQNAERHKNRGDCRSPWLAAFSQHAGCEPSQRPFGAAIGLAPSLQLIKNVVDRRRYARPCVDRNKQRRKKTKGERQYEADNMQVANAKKVGDTNGKVSHETS
jgi:hypothetical protein